MQIAFPLLYLSSISDKMRNLSLCLFLNLLQEIMAKLFKQLSDINNFEEILAEIVNTAAKRFENGLYNTPKEKHMLLKVVAFGLFLIDTGSKKNKQDKKTPPSMLLKMNDRSLSISRFDRLFKVSGSRTIL